MMFGLKGGESKGAGDYWYGLRRAGVGLTGLGGVG